MRSMHDPYGPRIRPAPLYENGARPALENLKMLGSMRVSEHRPPFLPGHFPMIFANMTRTFAKGGLSGPVRPPNGGEASGRGQGRGQAHRAVRGPIPRTKG